jgi:hypothetical protein
MEQAACLYWHDEFAKLPNVRHLAATLSGLLAAAEIQRFPRTSWCLSASDCISALKGPKRARKASRKALQGIARSETVDGMRSRILECFDPMVNTHTMTRDEMMEKDGMARFVQATDEQRELEEVMQRPMPPEARAQPRELDTPRLQECLQCGIALEPKAVKLCPCLRAAYCGPGCQKAHWKSTHKAECPLRKAKPKDTKSR